MQETQFFDLENGMRLAATVSGPEEGQPVLLFHGGGQTRHAWQRVVETLGNKGYRAMAFDQRGHGDSGWSESYEIELFRDDMLEICQQMPMKPYIVGASLGGVAGMLANAAQPEEVSQALVLVDVAPRSNPAGLARILDFMSANPNGFSSLEEAAEAVAAYQPHRKQRSDPSGLQKNLRQAEDGRWYWHWDPKALQDFQNDAGRRMAADILYAAAEKLTQPVLLVRGTLSDVIDTDIKEEFQTRIPHAQVVDVSGAGHMVAGDRNDIFSQTILDFLLSLDCEQAASA
ncbi:MAG: alpha/beta hydrolase [Salinisphaeraceae bacterium]|nr:alpha/beta hydrolase [Salinisphaeraceae bacterium]